jgi:glycosyltransferase involved in cell wall biosynthesis
MQNALVAGKRIAALTSYGPTLASVRGPLLGAMVAAGHHVIASAPDSSPKVVDELKRLGVQHHRLPLARRGLNPICDLLYCFLVFRFLRRERIDVCFLYTIKPVVFGSFAARCAGLREIYSLITGLGYAFEGGPRLLNFISKMLYRLALRSNAWVFFQNPDDRDLFVRERLVDPQKCSVVNGSGVDLIHYFPAPVPSGRPVFLMIARLLQAKGVMEFLFAAEATKAQFPQCRFRLIGRAESGPDAIGFGGIQRFVAAGVIEYLPDCADVRPELHACTVYVLPSYREGTPRSVLEAMACGRGIITTDVPGCRETVVEDVNGYLVRAKDAADLQKAIEKFLLAPALATRMGAASRSLAEEKFDVRMINRIMLEQMKLQS